MPESAPDRRKGLARHASRLRRSHVLAVLVLIGALLLVALYARNAGERERRLAETSFVAEADQLADTIRQRMLQYELSLRGGVALHSAAADTPTPRQWRGYVEGLDIAAQLPGLQGLGYVASLTPESLKALQLQRRADGQGLFALNPRGVRPHYGAVVYFEPEDASTREVIGYDQYSDPVRRAAMDAARDSGEVRLSAPLTLHQGAPGVLMFAAVYRTARLPDGQANRQDALVGWVFAPFRSSEFLQRSGIPVSERLAFRIVDVTDGGTRPVLASDGYLHDADGTPLHSVTQSLYGRIWRYDFQPVGTLTSPGMDELRITLAAGVLAALLMFAVVMTLARTQSRAEMLALRLSDSYRRSEQRFRNAMQYSAIGMVLLDRAGTIVETNPAMAEIAGIGEDALVGSLFERYFVDGPEQLSRTGQMQAFREGVHRSVRRLRRDDGDVREVHLASTVVPGDPRSDVVRLVQVDDVTERLRAAEKEIEDLHRQQLLASTANLASEAQTVGAHRVVAKQLPNGITTGDLRTIANDLRGKLQAEDAVIVLMSVVDGKVSLAAAATQQAVASGVKAGDLVKLVGQYIDGKGGGKPDLAQGTGSRPGGIDDALRAVRESLAG